MSPAINERVKTSCPKCLEQRSIILELRRSKTAIRRRIECGFCSHKFTTYELSEDTYKEYAKALEFKTKILKLFKNFLGEDNTVFVEKPLEVKCHTCSHYMDDLCTFGFPAAGTEDAADCTMYLQP